MVTAIGWSAYPCVSFLTFLFIRMMVDGIQSTLAHPCCHLLSCRRGGDTRAQSLPPVMFPPMVRASADNRRHGDPVHPSCLLLLFSHTNGGGGAGVAVTCALPFTLFPFPISAPKMNTSWVPFTGDAATRAVSHKLLSCRGGTSCALLQTASIITA